MHFVFSLYIHTLYTYIEIEFVKQVIFLFCVFECFLSLYSLFGLLKLSSLRDGWLLGLRPIVSRGTLVYGWDALRGGFSKGS